jgi:hypothetical protein
MALTEAQKVDVAALTYELYDTINDLAGSLNAAQEATVIEELALWEPIKTKQHLRLQGGSNGLDANFERKEEAIRRRVRNAFGLKPIASALSPTPQVYAGGTSRSDMASRTADIDRPASGFTTDLHRW